MQFAKILISWYMDNKRDLPWRESSDPYPIWLSEIMLQQTRVDQGLPYYNRFIAAFPTVFDLADAPLEMVLKLWQGLGYYSRARNLHQTATYVAEELDGVFPGDYKGLKELKGVGDYTASAVASFCFGEPVPVVDGNVYRVLSRYFGIETAINSGAGQKEFKALAGELLDKEQPALFNQGLMEFGALHCKPRKPLCGNCPFRDSCLALKEGRAEQLPVKLKKGKIKTRFFNYLVFSSPDNKSLLEQRKGKGIWEELYQFPLLETTRPIGLEEVAGAEKLRMLSGSGPLSIRLHNEEPVVHKLSHQHIHTYFWWIQTEDLGHSGIPLSELKRYPVPVLIQNFLEEAALD